jgi:hypothetical protein
MTQFLLPEYTPEYVESLRKGMAGWWGVPEEAVVAVMDGYTIGEGDQRQPLPAFKLAPGWRRTEVIEHPLPGVTTYGYKYERTDG